jgi:hypothetical protein
LSFHSCLTSNSLFQFAWRAHQRLSDFHEPKAFAALAIVRVRPDFNFQPPKLFLHRVVCRFLRCADCRVHTAFVLNSCAAVTPRAIVGCIKVYTPRLTVGGIPQSSLLKKSKRRGRKVRSYADMAKLVDALSYQDSGH